MPNDIINEGGSTLDSYLENLSSKPARFAVRLQGRMTFAFRRTSDWDDLLRIRQRTVQQTKSVIDGNLIPEWKAYVSSDVTLIGKAVHLAARHIGVLVDGVLTGEPWSELDFLKLAKADPHGFTSLMDAVNEELGVGWTVEDQEYFRPEAGTVEAIPDGTAPVDGGPKDLE